MTVRCLVHAALVTMMAVFGWTAAPTLASADVPSFASTGYLYESQHHTAGLTHATSERGPPVKYGRTAYDPAGHWSRGSSARPDGPTPTASTHYAAFAALVQTAWATPTTGRRAEATDGDSRSTTGAVVAAKSADEASSLVTRTVADAREWLGPGGRAITNDAGDKIFLSQNGLRRIRVDIKRPYPHEFGHAHVKEFIDGKWVRSGPIYPSDVPGR